MLLPALPNPNIKYTLKAIVWEGGGQIGCRGPLLKVKNIVVPIKKYKRYFKHVSLNISPTLQTCRVASLQ